MVITIIIMEEVCWEEAHQELTGAALPEAREPTAAQEETVEGHQAAMEEVVAVVVAARSCCI